MGLFLRSLGGAAKTVPDGREAVETAGKGAFDMLLLDISMPGMDGIDTLQTVRSDGRNGPATPAIAVSANVMDQQVARCVAHDFAEHVPKPLEKAALATAILRCLDEAASMPVVAQ